jgi:capsular polysaccharide biosynthesis protein
LDYLPNNYQTETLLRAGLDLSRIIPSNNHWNFHFQAKEVIVTSLTTPNDCPSLDSCLYLRRLYEQEIKSAQTNKYLYIQRLDSRKIVNEDELLNYLATLNCRIINPERLTVSEQASIFAGADVIIGPHGAGFTNIVFCKPSTMVIDLFSPEWINPCYWVISEHLNLKYGYLIGERLKQKETYKRANILIDINKLKVLLKKMESND